MNDRKFWDGKAVHVTTTNPQNDRRSVDIGLTDQAARELSLAIKRLKQTSLMIPESVTELELALDYVLVGDPRSVAEHRRMEASKGMTPDGGYKTPEIHINSPEAHPRPFRGPRPGRDRV